MRRDELLKSYLSDNARYADLINGYVFGGRQVVRPEDVTELDSRTGYRNGRTKYRDLLTPCITFVLYYGPGWDGGKDIHSLLNLKDIPPEVLKWVGNYTVNLINIRQMKDMDIFNTDLKQVFNFIKYSEDKIQLRRLVEGDPAYRKLEPEAYDVAVAFTRARKLAVVKDAYVQGGRVDMCKALTEMLQDERAEGIEQGIEQGKLDVLISLVEDGILSIAQAAERLGISEKDFRERMS